MLPACDHYAGSEKLMRKSMTLQQELGPLFDITFDCEDGAARGNEESHAKLAGELIASDENRFNRIGARVHNPLSPFFIADCELILASCAQKIAFLTVPKINGVAEVQTEIAQIRQIAARHGRPDLPIHVLIETHAALADVHAIAALPEIECLSFGIMDFVSSHYGAVPANAMRSPGQFSHPLVTRAKLEIAAACHAHGKVPSHNVTTEIKDSAVVANDANRALAEFAYTRMWSIHPSQIKPIIKAFAPRNSELHEAIQILTEAQRVQWGPISQHGRLHDRASYRYYWTILQRARLCGLNLPDAANALL
jgi:citrate lyase subunit beta/citryl-CoA lyase